MGLRDKYKRPRLPEGMFLLIDDDDVDDGPFRAADFAPTGRDGEWAAQTEGRPVFLRIARQAGDVIWSVDGEGDAQRLRIRPVATPAGAEIRS